MARRFRFQEAAKWVGTAACALVGLAAVANVLCGRLTVATGPCSEIGIDGGAIISFSWAGADWPEAEHWSFFERERSISDWADEWARDGIWPSFGQDGNERWAAVPLWIPFALTFAVTVWLWRDGRRWTVVALVGVAACCVATRVATRYFYDTYWPGHPDSFRAETALLPRLSFHHSGDYFWQDREQALIFLSACSVYALPPIIALGIARRRNIGVLITLACLALAASAARDVWIRWDSYAKTFLTTFTDSVFVIERCLPDVAWVVGLTVGGLVVGWSIYRVLEWRRSPPGRCRACGYDLRVQSALGIPRCPECGGLTAGGGESAR